MDAAVTTVTACPSCGEQVAPGQLFCESCGAELSGAAAPHAGADAADPAGSVVPSGSVDPGEPGLGPTAPLPVHEGTLLDDLNVAATDMAKRSGVLVADADLDAVPTVCASCQGAIAPDGYCEQCGVPAPRARDHWSDAPASWVAGVCDRGVRHSRNEDAMALAAGGPPGTFAALVVCDGVSSATDSDRASLAAARAARDVLIKGVRLPGHDGSSQGNGAAVPPGSSRPGSSRQSARSGVLAARLTEAAAAAQAKAVEAAFGVPAGLNPPSCTFVAALVEGGATAGSPSAPGVLVVGWIGDSRAYWLPDGEPAVQLTVDHSAATEAVAAGVPREEAERLPQAHAITRWLGTDAPDVAPSIAVQALDAPGWVLLCSDGLWNYCSAPADLGALVAGQPTAAARSDGSHDPAGLAADLVSWAVAQGGHDNITVTLVRISGTQTQVEG